jgi:hypothetical protein
MTPEEFIDKHRGISRILFTPKFRECNFWFRNNPEECFIAEEFDQDSELRKDMDSLNEWAVLNRTCLDLSR